MGSNEALQERYGLKSLSEIVPGLWQGMRPKTYIGYDLVISCEEFLAKKPMEDFMGTTIHCPMRDEDDFKIPACGIWAAAVAAHHVLEQQRGGKVLVHCSGGLNRSSLVTARILELLGYEAHEAVAIIRRSHDEFCLCNRQFERWVLREQLPTAETTTLG
jgi:hypothetical protein